MNSGTPIPAGRLGVQFRGEIVRTARWFDDCADEQWNKFLQIAQGSELSPLANILNLTLIDSIKKVLD